MLRFLYVFLLRLHPHCFRDRFGEEMLSIFDQERENRNVFGLIADALVSVLRQWMLRPEFRHTPMLASIPAAPSDGVPVFYTCHDEMPRPSALFNGTILSVALFAAIVFAINQGGSRSLLLIGSHHTHHSNFLVVRADADGAELTTVVTTVPDPAIKDHDPVRPFVIGYFRSHPILSALDRNHDLLLSAEEISAVSSVLRSLDGNGDGKVTAEELQKPVSADGTVPLLTPRARLAFMQVHPVLSALDADHDGEISAAEIENAQTALMRLDRNYDKKLSASEVLPDPVAFQVYLFFDLDTDGDGSISIGERDNGFAASFKSLFDNADRDGDGLVTEKELATEIRRRADLDRDGTVDWEELLTALKNGELARVTGRIPGEGRFRKRP